MLKWIAIGAGLLAVLVVGFLLALPWLVDLPRVQAYVSQAATQALGRPVRFASLSVSALPLPSVRLRALQVADDPRFGSDPVLTAEEVRIGLKLWPLVRGRVELADVTLDRLRVSVVEDPTGRLNVTTLVPPAVATRPPSRTGPPVATPAAVGGMVVSRLRVTRGAVAYTRKGSAAPVVRLEDVEVTATAAADRAGLALSGRATARPGGVPFVISEGVVGFGGSRAQNDLPVSAVVDVEAQDVAALAEAFMATPALSGPAKGRLRVGGTAARPTAEGEVVFARLTLAHSSPQCPPPQPRRFLLTDVRMPVALTGTTLESGPVRAAAASGVLSAVATVSWQGGALVRLRDIAIKALELKPLLVDYACQGYAVTGPLELTGQASVRPVDLHRTLNGSARFRIGRGQVVGAEALRLIRDAAQIAGMISPLLDPRGRTLAVGSPLDFESITGSATITNGVARTDDLVYRSENLSLAAAGTYDLASTRVDMALTVTQGRTQIKAQVTGTTSPRAIRIVPTDVSRGEREGIRRLLERLFR